jgi:predicted alpha-1,2-mannosidase
MLAYAQQDGGIWDRWLHLGAGAHVMTGDPAAPTLATFAAMGVRNFDAQAAFDSLYKQATMQNPKALDTAGCPGQCTGQRPALDTYIAKKYAPQDGCACWGGAAETLENSLADHSLAMWADRLGRRNESNVMYERANWWRNTFNPSATPNGGYQQARKADGTWQPGFSPSTDVGFAQGSSATYTWMVPQDVSGLGQLMGGGHVAVERLDRFFHDADGNWSVSGGSAVRYDPTNEPGIHIPWMYNGLGQPWKTQATVRRIVDTVYGTGPGGLPGNDDLGTMSAWFVFAAMGIFPQTPGRAEMLLSGPVFPKVVVDRSNGVRLTVLGRASKDTDAFIQKVSLDGDQRSKSWLPESFVQRGGTVAVTLGPQPRIGWATEPHDLPRDYVRR